MFNLASRGSFFIACEQALLAGRENEGELIATTSLEFEFHPQFPCGSPSTELLDFCQSVQSGNKHECKQTLKNMSLLMSSPLISISHWLFQCRYSNSRNVVASSPSFSHPTTRSPQRACLQATFFMISSCLQKVASTDNCPFPSKNVDKWSSVRVQFQQTT